MRIDGKALADKLLAHLADQVSFLKEKGTTPTLAVIQVGNDTASTSYINQKKKAADAIGAKLIHKKLPVEDVLKNISMLTREYNADPRIHGIIIQRPISNMSAEAKKILDSINPEKDVDGFVPHSRFEPPVALAVIKILEEIFALSSIKKSSSSDPTLPRGQALIRGSALSEGRFPTGAGMTFDNWLTSQNIVIIGRGDTAGKPIADALNKRQCATSIIHSQTPNPEKMMQQADIIISCVGKENVVKKEHIKPGVILISVGIWRDSAGKLHGDYEEADIQDIAAAYTPTPGGVGPVNVACLMQNLIKACTIHTGGTI